MDTKQNKKRIFEQMPAPRAVLLLSVPTMFSSIVMAVYSLADTYYVGKLGDPVQSAAVTLASPVLLAFNAIINLFGTGSSCAMSLALGGQRQDEARQLSAMGFYCALVCAGAVSLAAFVFRKPLLALLGADAATAASTWSYLIYTVVLGAVPSILNSVLSSMIRAEGAALSASIGVISGCVINIVLDPFFILPDFLNLGAAGAGLATLISNCAVCVFFLLSVKIKKETAVSFSLEDFRPEVRNFCRICNVGVPASIQNLLNVAGMVVLNRLVSSYGEAAVAAMGICQRINNLPVDMAIGFTQGTMPLIGYNYGSRNKDRMKQIIRFSGTLLTAVMACIAAGMFLCSGQLVGLFMNHDAVVEIGGRLLHGFALALPFLRIDFFCVGVLQACGKGKQTLIFAFLRKACLEIPALVLLNLCFGLYGLSYAQTAAEAVMAAVALVVLRGLLAEAEANT